MATSGTDESALPADTPPWVGVEYNFAGWIPNISGHLSFSIIGNHDVHPRCNCYNEPVSRGTKREIVVRQERYSNDYLIPGKLLKLFRRSMVQNFLLVAESSKAFAPALTKQGLRAISNEQGMLCGRVHVFPYQKNKEIGRKTKECIVKIRDSLDQGIECSSSSRTRIEELIRDALSAKVVVYKLDFALYRTGEIRIWFTPTTFFERDSGPNVLKNFERQIMEVLPEQVYYFLKDVCHMHYHHEEDSDQLLPLTRLTDRTAESELRASELSWRRETLWGLARITSQLRRKNELYEQKKALGFLAYADAFQQTLAKTMRKTGSSREFVEHESLSYYDFSHMRASLDSVESVSTWRRSGSIQLFSILTILFLSSLSIWQGAARSQSTYCGEAKSDWQLSNCTMVATDQFGYFLSAIALNPIQFTGSLLLLGAALFVLVFRDITFVPFGRHFRRFFRKVSGAIGASTATGLRHTPKWRDHLGWVTAMAVTVFPLALMLWLLRDILHGLF